MGENFLLFSQENSKSQSLMWTYTYVYDKCEFSDMFEYTKVKNMNSSCNSVVWKISTNFFVFIRTFSYICVFFVVVMCLHYTTLESYIRDKYFCAWHKCPFHGQHKKGFCYHMVFVWHFISAFLHTLQNIYCEIQK